MKKTLIIGIIVGLCFTACTPSLETRQETFQRMDAEIKANAKAYTTLQEATSTIGHRLTGSTNGAKAETYTYEKFKEYGFSDVAYQPFEVESWSRGELAVTIDAELIPAVTLGHSPVLVSLEGEIADIGNGLEVDYQNNPEAVKDKIALIYISILPDSQEGLSNLHRSEKTALALKYGAKGVIIFNSVDNGVLLTGTASVTGAMLDIPAVCISKEVGFALKEKLKVASVTATIEMTNNSDLINARNVVATLKGTSLPDEIIVIGGHLDSWDLATGAIDNGIGSFAVLDIARAFMANQLKPKRTVKFVMFMGEEQGLFGSRHMVDLAVESSQIEQIKYMFNLDMSGNPKGINAGGKIDDQSFYDQLNDDLNAIDTAFSGGFSNRSGLHSDHQPFMLEGVPILGVQSNLDRSIYGCYHADCDDFNLVNEQHITNTARFGSMMLYALANAEKLPATKMDSETTKQFMIDNDLKEKLIIGGDWRWKED
jgi:carboxypeptidase Q